MWLLVAFIAVPLIEIALFIQVGGLIGLWPTLVIVLVTAILGTWLVRSQGIEAMGQLRSSFNELRDPTEPLVHGAMILFAGALLLTPGFFTDAIGFSLLVPAIRRAVYRAIRSRVTIQSFDAPNHSQPSRPDQGDVIEGEYTEVEEGARRRSEGPSGWTKH